MRSPTPRDTSSRFSSAKPSPVAAGNGNVRVRFRFVAFQIRFVQHFDIRAALCQFQRLRVLLRERRALCRYEHAQIRAFYQLFRQRDTRVFYLVAAFAHARGIVKSEADAFQFDFALHRVARSARRGGNDGFIVAEQTIEYRAFARVGLSADRHRNARFRASARTVARKQHADAVLRFLQRGAHFFAAFFFHVLFGIIHAGADGRQACFSERSAIRARAP